MSPPEPEPLSHYLDRELSLLEFQQRVLALARDPEVPLLERLRFLTICSSNLDEFFEVRVAALREKVALGVPRTTSSEQSPSNQLAEIAGLVHELVADQYRVLEREILPALSEEGVRLLDPSTWSGELRGWLRRHLRAHVLPLLTPIGIDPAHPFPRVINKGLSFVVELTGEDAFSRASGVAVMQIPRSLPRLIQVPEELAPSPHAFVLLSSAVQEFAAELFPGMHVEGCFQFRVTRDSELWVDEEEVENLLHAVKGELPRRKYGQAVRLEVAEDCPAPTVSFLLDQVGLGQRELYRAEGPVNLYRLGAIYEKVDRPDLKYGPHVPAPGSRSEPEDMFGALRRGDVLLHHPYDSFAPVISLVRQAADDPDVLAIKMTLYRTDPDSALLEALVDAARSGVEVMVVIELRARFDEARNIDLATRLQEAGVLVVYGVVGYKTHAKLLMVVRREGQDLRRYVHLGTGNYHPGTARAYTDIGLMTCDREFGDDVHRVFTLLTGPGHVSRLRRLLLAPFHLHDALLERIDAERRNAAKGLPALIQAKVNSLAEPRLIEALYRASQAGVRIDLVVRGICCLRPGVPGLSENITVRSLVGRFLEHTRVYRFLDGGTDRVYCSSADWLPRNMFRRVEVAFPILDPKLKQRVVRECFDEALRDRHAWLLRSDGKWMPGGGPDRAQCRSQKSLIRIASGQGTGPELHQEEPRQEPRPAGEGLVQWVARRPHGLPVRSLGNGDH